MTTEPSSEAPTSAHPSTLGADLLPVPQGAGDPLRTLAEANLLRYRSASNQITEAPGVLASNPDLVARVAKAQERYRCLQAVRMKLLWAPVGLLAAGGAASVAAWTAVPVGVGAVSAIAFLAAEAAALDVRWHRARVLREQLDAEAVVAVPEPVASALARIRSAARTIAEDPEHPAETVATARLAEEGARALVAQVAEHAADGTLHTAAAVAAADEVFRLAAEVDAYLTVRDLDRFSDNDAAALTALGDTQPLTFLRD